MPTVKSIFVVIFLVVILVYALNLYTEKTYQNCIKDHETNKELQCEKIKRVDQ